MTDYFHHTVNSSLALRRLLGINIENPTGGTYKLRPQMHLFICQGFGTGKSSVFKNIKKAVGDARDGEGDCYIEDDFTRAGFQGSVNKNSGYVEGLVNRIGGKVLCVDEWNTVTPDGRSALLSVLENNYFSRNLGFSIKKELEPIQNEFTDIHVKNGNIEGSVYFTCIAGAMHFPTTDHNKEGIREDALVSRFTPYFRSFSIQDVLEMKNGKLYSKFEDYSPQKARKVTISKGCVKDIQDAYDNYVSTHKLIFDENKHGYVARVWADFVRLGVANAFKNKKGNSADYIIDKSTCFTKDMENNLAVQFAMFSHKDTKSSLEQFKEMVMKNPNQSKQFYADKLGLSVRTISRYAKDCNIQWINEIDMTEKGCE